MAIDELKERNDKRRMEAMALDFDKARAQREVEMNSHLGALDAEQQEYAQALNIVVQASIHKDGLPSQRKLEAFALNCEALAERLVSKRRVREWTETKALLDTQNYRSPRAAMVVAARRNGVALLTESPPIVKE